MRRRSLLLLVLALTLGACAIVPRPAPTATPVARRSGTLRFSQTTGSNVKDIPWFLTLDALRRLGYTIEVIPFAKSNLIPVALDKGDIDVADTNTTPSWAAAAQGADIKTIVAKSSVSYVIVGSAALDDICDVAGHSITFATRQSVGYLMFDRYLARQCPGAAPEIVLISESSNRLAALQGQSVDAAYLDLEDWLRLNREEPGKYRLLLELSREYGHLCFTTFSVRTRWAEQNPTAVKDLIRELLLAQRSVLRDRRALADAIVKYLEVDAATAAVMAEAYLSSPVWDPNGGISVADVDDTLRFLRDGGILTTELKYSDVADLSYLNAVLDEIGRE